MRHEKTISDKYTITLLHVTAAERKRLAQIGDEHVMGIFAKKAIFEKYSAQRKALNSDLK